MDGSVDKDQAILEEARQRFKDAKDADIENRKDALDDLKFCWNLNDYQWPEEAKRLRAGRPCLTENRLPQFVRIVVNSQRQNRPSINVGPVDSKGDPATAKILEGMIRHIEQNSRADLAYDEAFESAVVAGLGYFRISTRYVPGEGDNQEIYIAPINNMFSVYDDPDFNMPDGSDRKWCFVTEWISREQFRKRFKVDPAPFEDAAEGDSAADWCSDKKVMIAEYWRKVDDKVEWFLMSWDKVLDRGGWAGEYLPIVPVFGQTQVIDGERYRKSLIRDAKELQRANNYWFSVETESVALQPRTPWLGPVGAFETDAEKWATANTTNHAYLQYDMVEGQPPPNRTEPPQFPAAIRETRMGVIEGIKAVFGIYDASLGARSNETSGVALQERQEQGDQAVYHFMDNMTRAIRYAGLVIIDLLPRIYDAPRVVRVVEPDGESQMVAINQIFINQQTMQEQEIRLDSGRYDVVVKAGPSFQTQRQEAAKAMVELGKAYPPLMQVAGDLLMKNMDFPDAEKIADRLRPPSEIPQAKAQMDQMQQQMQQMQQMMEQGKKYIGELETKLQQAALESDRKDVDKARVQLQLEAKKAQDELMSGDTTGEEMLRLREENARQAIELKMKDLKLLEAQLGLKAHEMGMREQQLGERETEIGDRETKLQTEYGPEQPAEEAGPTVAQVLAQLAEAMQGFTVAQTQLTRALTADRVPVRDAEGRISAVRTMLQ